ncbi:heme peroxidase [Artemisia annua]|uniref:Heme peroxidase n=1 Tax=Artemisia annua TaxID=35608 RepID=A0A2U1Q1H1_ARTAN|nr:heme peroxidase [Artemisia annua]
MLVNLAVAMNHNVGYTAPSRSQYFIQSLGTKCSPGMMVRIEAKQVRAEVNNQVPTDTIRDVGPGMSYTGGGLQKVSAVFICILNWGFDYRTSSLMIHEQLREASPNYFATTTSHILALLPKLYVQLVNETTIQCLTVISEMAYATIYHFSIEVKQVRAEVNNQVPTDTIRDVGPGMSYTGGVVRRGLQKVSAVFICILNWGFDYRTSSLMIHEPVPFQGEKNASTSLDAPKGLDIIYRIDNKLAFDCPETVLCADALITAAIDATFLETYMMVLAKARITATTFVFLESLWVELKLWVWCFYINCGMVNGNDMLGLRMPGWESDAKVLILDKGLFVMAALLIDCWVCDIYKEIFQHGEATEPMIKELDEDLEESQYPEVEFAIAGSKGYVSVNRTKDGENNGGRKVISVYNMGLFMGHKDESRIEHGYGAKPIFSVEKCWDSCNYKRTYLDYNQGWESDAKVLILDKGLFVMAALLIDCWVCDIYKEIFQHGEATEPMIKELDEDLEESQYPEVEFAIAGSKGYVSVNRTKDGGNNGGRKVISVYNMGLFMGHKDESRIEHGYNTLRVQSQYFLLRNVGTHVTTKEPTWITTKSPRTSNYQQQKKQSKLCETYKQSSNAKPKSALDYQQETTTGLTKEKTSESKTKKPKGSSSNWKPSHTDWAVTTSKPIEVQDHKLKNNKCRYNIKGFLEDDESDDDSMHHKCSNMAFPLLFST